MLHNRAKIINICFSCGMISSGFISNHKSYLVAHAKGSFASGRVEEIILFHENLAICKISVKKKNKYHCCRRRIGPFIPANAWFGTDCVMRATQPVVSRRSG